MPPQDREALDWLTLVRFLGWSVRIYPLLPSGKLLAPLSSEHRVLIIACDQSDVSEETARSVASVLEDGPVLVIARAARPATAFARLSGTSLTGEVYEAVAFEWRGPGPHRTCRLSKPVTAQRLWLEGDTVTWATADNVPVVTACPRGRGIIATLAIHPSETRDRDPSGTGLMKALLTWGSPGATAWLDFEHTLVLRMDDPGGAQNIYSRSWCYPKLGTDAWTEIGRDLSARNARISLGYISGWVDDGDENRGRVTLRGESVSRSPGTIYPSPLVRYEDIAGHLPGAISDYTAEFRGIQALRNAGLGDVELHGYTHMHPDREAWLHASNRFENSPQTAWFRELGEVAVPALERMPPDDHPLARAAGLFRDYFGSLPTTLICPGDQWTNAALERALDLGLRLVSSYYLAIRHDDRFCWTVHVCAPYLNEPDSSWFSSELPVIGYFHDYEPAIEGAAWMTKWIDCWQRAGARRLIDFRELSSALGCRLSLEQNADQLRLLVSRPGAPAAVRPIPVRVRALGSLPDRLLVQVDGRSAEVTIRPGTDGTGVALLPLEALG
jgi:hypothetical protein